MKQFKTIAYCIYTFIVLFLLLCLQASYAVNKRYLDSVYVAYLHAVSDSEKMQCLYSLSYEYGFSNPKIGIQYGQQCLALAKLKKSKFHALNAYNGLGNAYETLSDYDSARYYHMQSLQLARALHDERKIATTLINIAITYKEQGLYEQALAYQLEALRNFESKEQYNPRIHFFIGQLYIALNNISEAERHSRTGIRKCKELGYYDAIHSLNLNLAICLTKQNKIDSAILLLQHSLQELKGKTDVRITSQCLHALGEAWLAKKNSEEALVCFQNELALQEQLSNKEGVCSTHLIIATTMLQQPNPDKQTALQHIALAQKSLSQLLHNKDALRDVYFKMASLYESLGHPNEALNFYKLYFGLKDSLLNLNSVAQLNELQTRYETVKKQSQIELQKTKLEAQTNSIKHKNVQLILLISVLLLTIITALFSYSRYRTRQQFKFMLEVERQEKLREFALIEKEQQERERISKDIHDELGAGLSKIALLTAYAQQKNDNQILSEQISTISTISTELRSNITDLVWALNPNNNTLENLVARMHEYAGSFLEDLNLTYSLHFPDDIPAIAITREIQRNIFLTFKEAVSNAAKHAKATTITITASYNSPQFMISITDDGIGFEHKKIKISNNGLRNMQERMNIIGGEFELHTSSSGTKVLLTIPIQ